MTSDEFHEATAAIIQAATEVGHPDAYLSRCPELIFHYTDVAGLVAILNSQCLRLSLATSLNDASEVSHGIRVAREFLLSGVVPTGMSPHFPRMVEHFLDPNQSPKRYKMQLWPCVASYCGRQERSTHWSLYGRMGKGVALGIDSSVLGAMGHPLIPVIYAIEEQVDLIRSVLERVASVFVPATKRIPDDSEKNALGVMAAHLSATLIRSLAARMKHPSFDSEEEWRLVAFDPEQLPSGLPPGPPLQFRCSEDRVVPYMDVDVRPLPLKEIILGANCSMAEDDPALKIIISRRSPEFNPSIRRSTVLLRP